MIAKLFLLGLSMLLLSGVDAAEVRWDLFSSRESNYQEPGIQLYYYGHGTGVNNIQPEIGIIYEYVGGNFTSINGLGPSNVGINEAIWIDAQYGDVLADDYFASRFASGDRLYVETGFYDSYWVPTTPYSRMVTSGENIYIAFAGKAHRGYDDMIPFYGWLELLVKDAELSLVTSALTYSPGLIVGTGDFGAIPEPSSGCLSILGIVFLALRRRRINFAKRSKRELQNDLRTVYLLPSDYSDYLGTLMRLPVVQLNQEKQAIVQEIISTVTSANRYAEFACSRSSNELRHPFGMSVIHNDSGSPCYLIIGNTPVLLYAIKGQWGDSTNGSNSGSGYHTALFCEEIQTVMDELSDSTGQVCVEINFFDFSNYARLKNWR